MFKPFRPLKPSQKIRVAVANGVKTVAEYAQYQKRNRERTNKFPEYMNRAIAEGVKNASKC